jgi:hypothetical protein
MGLGSRYTGDPLLPFDCVIVSSLARALDVGPGDYIHVYLALNDRSTFFEPGLVGVLKSESRHDVLSGRNSFAFPAFKVRAIFPAPFVVYLLLLLARPTGSLVLR